MISNPYIGDGVNKELTDDYAFHSMWVIKPILLLTEIMSDQDYISTPDIHTQYASA